MKRFIAVAVALLASACGAHAATEPPDPCALLTAAQVSRTMGDSYAVPTKTVAPRPFPNTVEGTDCHYSTGRHELLFRIYFDGSAADATSLFAKLKMFYSPPRPVKVGDEAYFDRNHGLHVRKGNVRFFLEGPEDEGKVTALGQVVAGEM